MYFHTLLVLILEMLLRLCHFRLRSDWEEIKWRLLCISYLVYIMVVCVYVLGQTVTLTTNHGKHVCGRMMRMGLQVAVVNVERRPYNLTIGSVSPSNQPTRVQAQFSTAVHKIFIIEKPTVGKRLWYRLVGHSGYK